MKTNQLPGKGTIVFKKNDTPAQENHYRKQLEENREQKAIAAIKAENKRVISEFQERNCHVDAVKKQIAESIQWREMRFYRHENQGQVFIDIIDKETGEVLRTIPEKDFQEMNSRLKQYSGYNIDISG